MGMSYVTVKGKPDRPLLCIALIFRLENEDLGPEQADPLQKEKSFIFLRVPILREYLEKELSMPNLTFPFDLERAIDDWVSNVICCAKQFFRFFFASL